MKTQSQNWSLSLIMCIIFSSLLFSCFPEKTTLPVVHQKKSNSSSLQQDKLRVEIIEARLKSPDSETSKLPVGIETSGSYVINNIVLGNVAPPRSSTNYAYYFHLDTLIDQFWVRCLQAPCEINDYTSCESTTYNPHDSTAYKEIDCKSSMCTNFLPPGITSCSVKRNGCLYATLYDEDEEEYSFGSIIQDQLNLTPNLFPEFTFLCTQNNSKGMFPNNASGILGLGRDTNASFLSQTQGAYGWKFSYCLPHLKDSVGFLTLGSTTNNNDDDGVKFTPLVANNTSLYIIKITSITIGVGNNTFLHVLSHTLEAVVDTGLKYTRLPPDVYDALNANFTNRMINEMNYSSAINYTSDDGLLTTCFDITGKEARLNAPSVKFTFEGNVTVGLDIFNLLDVVETNRTACLAFIKNNHTTDAVVLGTTQQKMREVVYDLPNNKLGFGTTKACT